MSCGCCASDNTDSSPSSLMWVEPRILDPELRQQNEVLSSCVPPVNYELGNNDRSQNQPTIGAPAPPPRGLASTLKSKMARSKEEASCDLDLTYITERIIAMSFPWEGQEAAYKSSIKEVAQMLKSKHGDNYMVINISRQRPALHKLNHKVLDFGWPDHIAPPLERLCSICKSVDVWMNADPRNVAVIHSKGSKGCLGLVIAGYMHYNNICASADQALDRFAMKRFYDDKLAMFTHPSQRRYVNYFSGLLSGEIKMNSAPLFLHHIIIHGVPNFDPRGTCRPFVKVYQAMTPVFMSGVYAFNEGESRVCISMEPSIRLHGDILVKCYHKRPHSSIRDIVFRCQFHTCAISDESLVYSKLELDDACVDPRFPEDSRVELVFSTSADASKRHEAGQKKSTAVEASVGPYERWDSYENFNVVEPEDSAGEDPSGSINSGESRVKVQHIQHTTGPVDGCIYATVAKGKPVSHTAPHPAHELPGQHGTLHNGPLTHSADSGISSASGQVATSSSHTTRSVPSSTMSTALTNHLPNHPPTASEQQLDEILSELLSDDLLKTGGTLTRSNGVVTPSSGCVTSNSSDARTILSWESSQAGPTKSATVTSESKARPAPGCYVETKVMKKEERSEGPDSVWGVGGVHSSSSTSAYSQQSRTLEKRMETVSETSSRQPERFMSPPPPPPRQDRVPSPSLLTDLMSSNRSRSTTVESTRSQSNVDGYMSPPQRHERAVSPTVQVGGGRDSLTSPTYKFSPTSSPKVYTLPGQIEVDLEAKSRIDLESRSRLETQSVMGRPYADHNTVSDHRGYASDSEEPLSWLEQQQVKLQAKRDHRDWHKRSEHEKRLVAELRNAQHSLHRRNVESSDHDEKILRQYTTKTTKESHSMNGPSSSWRNEDKPFRRPASPEPVRRTVQETHSKSRTFSPESSITVSSSSTQKSVPRHRTMSESAADRSVLAEKSYWVSGVERPPFTTHQTKYTFSVSNSGPSATETETVAAKPPRSPVFGRSEPTSPTIPARGESSRVAVERSKFSQAYTPNLDDLDRTLQEVLKSAPPLNTGYESDDVFSRGFRMDQHWQTNHTFTKTEQTTDHKKQAEAAQVPIQPPAMTIKEQPVFMAAPPPRPPPPQEEEEEIEEEVISLEPIGPGLQSLEPANAATLPRATTPAFPLQDDEEETEIEVVSLAPVGPGVHYLEPSKLKPNTQRRSTTPVDPHYATTGHAKSPTRQQQQSWSSRTVERKATVPTDWGTKSRTSPRGGPGSSPGGLYPPQAQTPPFPATTPKTPYENKGPPVMEDHTTRTFSSNQFSAAPAPPYGSRSTTPAFPVSPHGGDTMYNYQTVTRTYKPESRPTMGQVVVTEVERFPVQRSKSVDAVSMYPEVQRFPANTARKQPYQQQEVVEVERFPAHQMAASSGRSQSTGPQRATTISQQRTVHTTQYQGDRSEGGVGSLTPGFPVTQQDQMVFQQGMDDQMLPGNQQYQVVKKTTTIERDSYGKEMQGGVAQHSGQQMGGGTQQSTVTSQQQHSYNQQGRAGNEQIRYPMTRSVSTGGDGPSMGGANQQMGGANYHMEERSQQMGGRNASTQQTSVTSQQQHSYSSQQGGASHEPVSYSMTRSVSTGGDGTAVGAANQQMGGVSYHTEERSRQMGGTNASTQHTTGSTQEHHSYRSQQGGTNYDPASYSISRSISTGGDGTLAGADQQMGGVSYHMEERSQQMGGASQQMRGASQQMGGVNQQMGGANQNVGGVTTVQQTTTYSTQQQQQQHAPLQRQNSNYQNGYTVDSLTVDTNQRGMGQGLLHSPCSATSTQSPPSPSSFQAFQSQFSASSAGGHSMTGQSSPSVYFGQSRRSSLTSLNEGADIVHHTPKFVRDTSKFWYKANISRDEAIHILRDKPPGTFVVRDSNSFPGAFGLALKVAQVPPNVQTKGGDPLSELVRHFLIEPTPKGVKLKGCSNEPVFGSLAALVYQHSITPLALPCKLLLSESDASESGPGSFDIDDGCHPIMSDPADHDMVDGVPNSPAMLLTQGAACNVLYLTSMDMESLTGPEAIGKTVKYSLTQQRSLTTTVVHFKVSSQGITLTDNKRKLFFRRHYPLNSVTFCAMDPEEHRWTLPSDENAVPLNSKIFGFVARKQGTTADNACHIFAELDPEQPATAIVNFVAKIMIGQGRTVKT